LGYVEVPVYDREEGWSERGWAFDEISPIIF